MSIAEYWAKLADIEDGQRESTVGETTGGERSSQAPGSMCNKSPAKSCHLRKMPQKGKF
jgi:hypothetical protein